MGVWAATIAGGDGGRRLTGEEENDRLKRIEKECQWLA
jgi:hypothetical protein